MENKYMFKSGVQPDVQDERDYVYQFWWDKEVKLPISYDISLPKIRDQKDIGSCASFAITTILAKFYQNKREFSPLYVYYNARVSEFGEDAINQDTGNTLRGVLKSINKTGFCSETFWRYNTSEFATKPSVTAYETGQARVEGDKLYYTRALTVDAIKKGIADGYVPYLGYKVYNDECYDEMIEMGVMSLPVGDAYGGHAVVISGYDDNLFGGCFKIHNSWGSEVGHKGYFYIPYNVFEKLIMDCWLVKVIPDIIK